MLSDSIRVRVTGSVEVAMTVFLVELEDGLTQKYIADAHPFCVLEHIRM